MVIDQLSIEKLLEISKRVADERANFRRANAINILHRLPLPGDESQFIVAWEGFNEAIANRYLNLSKMPALNKFECACIFMYTWDNISRDLNDQVVDNNLLDEVNRLFADYLRSSLNKLNSYRDKNVVRWVDYLDAEYFASLVEGKMLAFNFFLSTSKDIERGPGYFYYNIQTKSDSLGKDISSISARDTEQEVLFMPGSKFLIERIDRTKKIVYLREI